MLAHRPLRRAAWLVALASLLGAAVGVAPVRAVGLAWTVDSPGDAPDANTGLILCRTIVDTCTLRAAIMQANAIDPGPGNHHTIIVPAMMITMFIEGVDEEDAATGDYDVKRSVTIRGAGRGETIIQGSTTTAEDAPDRIFDLQLLGMDFVLEDLTVRRGNAVNAAGGGIRVNSAGANITLDNVAMNGNRSFDSVGAAIAARGGVLSVTDSRFANNAAPDGPVVDVDGGSVSIERTTFANNVVWDAALKVHGNALGFVNTSTFSGQDGLGAMPMALHVGRDNADTTEVTVRNSTFADNDGPDGASVVFASRNVGLSIQSSTIAGNDGSGISSSANTHIRNTLLAGNSGGSCSDAVTSEGHNLDSGSSCPLDGPGDISSGTADLDALADNGGPTRTRALGPDSDAIDAGLDCPNVDQRGASRPKDGDGNGNARCDIGAYEAPKLVLPSPTPTVAPTLAQTAAPTLAATAAPTDAPVATVAPTEPPAASGSPAPSPAATSAGPATSTPGPAVTTAPDPAANPLGSDAMLWIVLAVIALVIAIGLVLAMRRRRTPAPEG